MKLYQLLISSNKEELAMLVFKEIEEAVRSVKGNLTTLGGEKDLILEEQRLQLLVRIVVYVNSFDWLSHDKTREKLNSFIQSRYNYRETAEKFGVSVKSLHVSVSYASSRLKKRLGSVLALLEVNEVIAAEREFLIGIGRSNPSDVFVGGIANLFSNPVKNTGVELSTCQRELSFLSYFTIRNIDRVISTLDRAKVCHLLYILLRNDTTYVSERGILISCLEGELKASEAISLLKEDFVYSQSTKL
jgi:hypothetical protein